MTPLVPNLFDATLDSQAELLARLAARNKMSDPDVVAAVEAILDEVRLRGDAALLAYTARFDGVQLTADQLRLSQEEIRDATASLPPDLLAALRQAAENIRAFHRAQLPDDLVLELPSGGSTRLLHRPLSTVGVYVPGGRAPLPSSVLMNVIPAKVAGVGRIVMMTPPRADGSVDPAILAAADLAGVDEIHRIGGAQAIAALAYGTGRIPAVDKICGPGNIYVNTAKRLVYGTVDIDLFAGPSEILILADQTANPAWLACDLMSQAEHDPLASAILLTPHRPLAEAVARELTWRIPLQPRAEIIRQSWNQYGALVVTPDLETAVDFANQLAPEHLELCVENPEALLTQIRHAGAVFMGPYSPEPLGDYLAGPNHVLPTSGTARFFSLLNTGDFLKKMSVIDYREPDLATVWQQVACLADAEQLTAHGDAVRIRFQAPPQTDSKGVT